ncbi:MAG: phage major capsid protein [Armatimonadetes bacterium]|nr:phage major capsid protein [Anaerolineae bacterium]
MSQTTVKTLNATEARIGGYLIVWGSAKMRDLDGEYFTPQTALALDWFERRPVLYHHGQDDRLKAEAIGVMDTLRADTIGIWAEAQLDTRQRYVQAVLRLVERGALAWSSGSVSHLVEVAQDGRIVRWPIVEGSLTPTPAEPRRTDVQMIKSAFKQMGLDASALDNTPSHWASTLSTKGPSMTYLNDENDLASNLTLETAPRKRLPAPIESAKAAAQISVGSAYDRLDALDLLHGYVLLRAAKSFQGVSEQYANALAHKLRKTDWSASAKANELMTSLQAGFGDEWVPELWSAQIWEKARMDNVLLPLFRSIEMPSNPFDLPIEGIDPTVYYVSDTLNESQLTLSSTNSPIPDSKIGSGKVQLNARKLALRVGFSAELVEDAIIPVLNLYREQAIRAIADSIDFTLLNGDTETGAALNINTSGTPGATDRYLIFDGLRKLPIVTNTANTVAMAGDPTLAKLRETRFKMLARYAARPADLAWIVDSGTYAKLLGLSEFLTMDKAGAMATAQTGQIGFMDGAPVFISAEMALTAASGKVEAASNIKGTALCVYRPGWFLGYRRRIAVNVDYLPYFDSYQLTATVRLAFAPFDTEVASALINITV